MSKKHFVALAAEIAAIQPTEARQLAAEAVARVAARFNPAFDLDRFMSACNALGFIPDPFHPTARAQG